MVSLAVANHNHFPTIMSAGGETDRLLTKAPYFAMLVNT